MYRIWQCIFIYVKTGEANSDENGKGTERGGKLQRNFKKLRDTL